MQKQEEKFQKKKNRKVFLKKKNTTFKAKPQKKLLKRVKRTYKKRIRFKARSRILKLTKHALNPLYKRILLRTIAVKKLFVITLRIKANNIFCTLVQNSTKVTKHTGSCGKYKIKTSKRKLKFVTKSLLKIFFEKISSLIKRKYFLHVNLISPKKVRRLMIKSLPSFEDKSVVLDLKAKKCFNGCRPPKKVRKKRRRFRIFK